MCLKHCRCAYAFASMYTCALQSHAYAHTDVHVHTFGFLSPFLLAFLLAGCDTSLLGQQRASTVNFTCGAPVGTAVLSSAYAYESPACHYFLFMQVSVVARVLRLLDVDATPLLPSLCSHRTHSLKPAARSC